MVVGFAANQLRAQFDNFPETALGIVERIGNYKGLTWSSLSVSSQFTTGVISRTPPNSAAYSGAGRLLNGVSNITPIKSGSTFDLTSLFFGCVVSTEETVAGKPTACTMTVTGYNGSDEVGAQSFVYEPSDLLLAPMEFARLSTWAHGLTNVSFETATDTLIATKLDNVRYTIYS